MSIRVIEFDRTYSHKTILVPAVGEFGEKTFERKLSDELTPTDWVLYAPRDAVNNAQTWQRVKDLMPPARADGSYEATESAEVTRKRWEAIRPHYEAWLKGMDIPENGTPLGAWPGLDVRQAAEFKKAGIVTVEEIASMTDSMLGAVRLPDVRKIREMAKQYLSATEAASATSVIEELQAQIAEMRAEKEKPRRGRPPKQVEDVGNADH